MNEMARYDYDKDPCRCPKCNGLGFPWAGYFTCEECGAVFFIKTGEEVTVLPGGKVVPKKLIDNVEDMPPEINKLVDKHFWELF